MAANSHSSPTIVLYSNYKSTCSWRLRIVLNLKEIPYDLKTAGRSNGTNLIPIPRLLIDGINLFGYSAIVHYLEETREARPLLPQDPPKRAKVREIFEIIASDIQPLQNDTTLDYIEDESKKQPWAEHWIKRGFRVIEEILLDSAGKYCVGDEITLADCYLVPQVFNARRLHVDLLPYPLIVCVDRELRKHPAFISADPSRQPDCPADEVQDYNN